MSLYSFFDKAALEYAAPIGFSNDAVARRYFENFCRKSDDKALVKDLSLFYVGEFDVDTGTFTGSGKPRHICDGASYLEE